MQSRLLPAHVYPFSAILGQESMKLGLILNAINPSVGGLLIRGEKGTAKSTAVRGLANILPEIEVVADCPYSCDPKDINSLCHSCRNVITHRDDTASSWFVGARHASPKGDTCVAPTRDAPRVESPRHEAVPGERPRGDGRIVSRHRKVRVVELPLNATEEMVVGGLDFSASIRDGKRVFQPGLMARANRGILYIDEVNLLPDHLVDVILDVCASGENVVQREGISHRHPARFILIGTMNPEEGELRPQLLDRFGLCVNVQGEQDLESRVEVLRRRDSFDRAPHAFVEGFANEESRLQERVSHAREMLPGVALPKPLERLIADLCIHHNVAGHRADIVIANAARALAAFAGRHEATLEDVRRAAVLGIPHRSRILAHAEDCLPGNVSFKRPSMMMRLNDYFEE